MIEQITIMKENAIPYCKWETISNTTEKYIDKYGYNNVEAINILCQGLYLTCNTISILEKATKWMQKITEDNDQYTYMNTYASLLYKTQKYADAKTWAEKAIDYGKKHGKDVRSTKELLEMIKIKMQ